MTTDQRQTSRRRRLYLLAAVAGVAAAIVAAAIVAAAVVTANRPNGHLDGSSPVNAGASALVGVDWRLVAIGAARASVHSPGPFLHVNAGGHVNYSDGCNTVIATIGIRADHLVITRPSTTLVSCARSALTDAIHAVLPVAQAGTVQWSISGNELTVGTPAAQALTYRRQG